MTKITMSDIVEIPQEITTRYYLKISGDEHFMSTAEYTNDVIFPYLLEHGVLEDIERTE